MKQLGLDLEPPPAPPPHRFDGETYDPKVDQPRLARQLERVRDHMLTVDWLTLQEIASATGGYPEASISARLRDLRKVRFGSYEVVRRRRGNVKRGHFEYRVRPGAETP